MYFQRTYEGISLILNTPCTLECIYACFAAITFGRCCFDWVERPSDSLSTLQYSFKRLCSHFRTIPLFKPFSVEPLPTGITVLIFLSSVYTCIRVCLCGFVLMDIVLQPRTGGL